MEEILKEKSVTKTQSPATRLLGASSQLCHPQLCVSAPSSVKWVALAIS